MNNIETINLIIIVITFLIGSVLGFLSCLLIIIRENKALKEELDKFRDLYFNEHDIWSNKYDKDDYEAY